MPARKCLPLNLLKPTKAKKRLLRQTHVSFLSMINEFLGLRLNRERIALPINREGLPEASRAPQRRMEDNKRHHEAGLVFLTVLSRVPRTAS